MSPSEDLHKLTEVIYKNLVDNFNGGLRQVLLTGKAYHKALHSVSVTANAYNDALSRLGSAGKVCRGGTDEIGEAILQIAETQKELLIHMEETSKALFTELLLPLEQKLEKDFKKASFDMKHYNQGNKVVQTHYNKAFDSLKKFRKKTKNKYMYDNEKEAQLVRTLDKCQAKLEEYRVESVKKALLEERRCYCFVLQRLCAISQTSFMTHRHGLDLYTAIPVWRGVCSNPHALPPAADRLIAEHFDGDYEPISQGFHDNSFLHRDGQPLRRTKSSQDVNKLSSGYLDGTRTLPHRQLANGDLPSPPTTHSHQVEAIYSFTATVDNQLSFTIGDIITLMGDKSEGWQYGQNVETKKMGWFPLSFTQPVRNARTSPELRAGQRAKSISDLLDSRSLGEHHFHELHDVPGNIRRPRSLYERPPGSPKTASGQQTNSSDGQKPSAAPPPPPIPSRSGDDNSIGDDANYQNNSMFSSVSLRKAKTNDRSAPKIK